MVTDSCIETEKSALLPEARKNLDELIAVRAAEKRGPSDEAILQNAKWLCTATASSKRISSNPYNPNTRLELAPP